MLINEKPEIKRAANLMRAVREIGERPATYISAIEEGDIQCDYLQLHIFKLFDGLQVILEAPSLNRSLGKLLS